MYGIKLQEKTVCGETVYIQNLNGSPEAIRVIELFNDLQKNSGIKAEDDLAGKRPDALCEIGALLMVCCLCDKDGNQLHTDPAIARRKASFTFLCEFAAAALSVSGLTDDPEDAVKNSEADQ